MAEYYAVLSRAVASLEANTPETRRAVYDKARNALIGQLKAIVPPLPTSEISRQRLELEEAIRRAEREAANGGRSAGRRSGRPDGQVPRQVRRLSHRRPESASPPSRRRRKRRRTVEDMPSRSRPGRIRRRRSSGGRSAKPRARADIMPPPVERAPVREEAYGGAEADFQVADRAPAGRRRRRSRRPMCRRITVIARRPESEPEPRLAPDYAWEREAPQPNRRPRYAPTPQLDGDDRPARIRDGRRRGSRGRDRDAIVTAMSTPISRTGRRPSVAAADHSPARADRRPDRRPGGSRLVAARRAFQALAASTSGSSAGSEQTARRRRHRRRRRFRRQQTQARRARTPTGCPQRQCHRDDARRARGRRDRRCRRGGRRYAPTWPTAPQPQQPAAQGGRCGAGGAEGGSLRRAARQRQGSQRRHPDQCRGDVELRHRRRQRPGGGRQSGRAGSRPQRSR